MTIILYLILFFIMIIAAPLLMIFRSYWGWRYGLFVIFAWFIGLAIHTESFMTMLGFAGFEKKILVDSAGFWHAIEKVSNFPVQKVFFNPFILAVLYLAGALLLPVQLLITGFLRIQDHPSGSTGHFWLDNESSTNTQFWFLFIPVAGFFAYMILGEMRLEREFAFNGLATSLLLIISLLVVSALGGKHRRILTLDKSLSFGGFSLKRKTKQHQPFEKPPVVALKPPKMSSGEQHGLDHIFAQRPPELANMAD